MKSGMLAAEAMFNALASGAEGRDELTQYGELYQQSWLYDELHKARNIMPAQHRFGMFLGAMFAWIDQYTLEASYLLLGSTRNRITRN